MVYLKLIGLWSVYFFIHSAMASSSLKSRFNSQYYRVFYTIIASLGLLGVFIFSALQSTIFVWQKNEISQVGGLILATYGILILKKSFQQYSIKEFLGLKKGKEEQLIRSGILHYVRHPIYTATILMVLGFFLFSPTELNLVSLSCIFIYLAIGIQLEERKLVKLFGDQYLHYQKEVPMLFPKGMRWMNLLK